MITESRLSKNDGYKRPTKTLQDKLTAIEIKEKLEDYVQIKNFDNVQLNTHIRYFSKIKDGKKTKKIFRFGGFLKNKVNVDKYVILSNGKSSWSVQVENTVFFRKLTLDEIKEQYEDEIDDLKLIIKNLKKKNKKLKDK